MIVRAATVLDGRTDRLVLAVFVTTVGGAGAVAATTGESATLTATVTFACVTLAVAAHLLRQDADQRRTGLLLYLAAGCLFVSNGGAVLGSAGEWLGVLTMWWAVAPLGAVLLTYPGRRVARRWHRWLLVAVTLDFVVLWTLRVALSALPGTGGLREPLATTAMIAGVVLPALVCVALVERWSAAAAPERQAVRSVALVGLALAVTFAVRLAVRGVAGDVYAVARTVNLVCLALAPVGLLLEALRRRAARARMIESLLEVGSDTPRIREAMRRATSDPSLDLLPADAPEMPPGPDRIRRLLRSPAGTAVAVVDADETVTRDPDQLRAALAAGALALDHARLQAQLVRRLEELEQSRSRIVEATVRSRRQLERDLHDGAQQQLLAVAATLARAELLGAGNGRGAAIGEARRRLAEAIAELRRLARGIHPAVLDRGGLPAALPTLADAVAVPVEIAASGAARLSAAIETTLWFVAAEAVTNAARHSGADRIRIHLETVAGCAALSVEDDGRGGARPLPGGGLAGLADRVDALGGALSVSSAPEAGTRVEAVLPCAS